MVTFSCTKETRHLTLQDGWLNMGILSFFLSHPFLKKYHRTHWKMPSRCQSRGFLKAVDHPKRKLYSLPKIHFQGRTVRFRECNFQGMLVFRWGSMKNNAPSWLDFFRGWQATQLYRDYNNPLWKLFLGIVSFSHWSQDFIMNSTRIGMFLFFSLVARISEAEKPKQSTEKWRKSTEKRVPFWLFVFFLLFL